MTPLLRHHRKEKCVQSWKQHPSLLLTNHHKKDLTTSKHTGSSILYGGVLRYIKSAGHSEYAQSILKYAASIQ